MHDAMMYARLYLAKHDIMRRLPCQKPRREEHVLVCAKNPVVPTVDHSAVSGAQCSARVVVSRLSAA